MLVIVHLNCGRKGCSVTPSPGEPAVSLAARATEASIAPGINRGQKAFGTALAIYLLSFLLLSLLSLFLSKYSFPWELSWIKIKLVLSRESKCPLLGRRCQSALSASSHFYLLSLFLVCLLANPETLGRQAVCSPPDLQGPHPISMLEAHHFLYQ